MVGHKLKKAFTDFQKNKIVDPGYWFDNSCSSDVGCSLIHVSKNHETFHTRSGLLGKFGVWHILDWYCAPTKTKVRKNKNLIYFSSYNLLNKYLEEKYPDLHKTITKSPIDEGENV